MRTLGGVRQFSDAQPAQCAGLTEHLSDARDVTAGHGDPAAEQATPKSATFTRSGATIGKLLTCPGNVTGEIIKRPPVLGATNPKRDEASVLVLPFLQQAAETCREPVCEGWLKLNPIYGAHKYLFQSSFQLIDHFDA